MRFNAGRAPSTTRNQPPMSLTPEDKAFITAHFESLQGDIAALNFRIATLATRDNLTDMETRLLTAFQLWASPVEARMNSNRAVLREFDIALEAVQTRLKKLEDSQHPKH